MRTNKLLIVGDSISEGTMGWSYAHFLKKDYPIVNLAVPGHTVKDDVEDVRHFFNTENVRNFKAVCVMVGTVDVTVPYGIKHDEGWANALGKDTFHYSKDEVEFSEHYKELLDLLLTKFAKDQIIVMTIPPFELSMEAPYHERHAYNANIRAICSEKGISHLINVGSLTNVKPVHGAFDQFELEYVKKHKYEAFWTFHFPFTKNLYGRIRHLNLTIDGLHFNSFSAKRLAKAVKEELNKI